MGKKIKLVTAAIIIAVPLYFISKLGLWAYHIRNTIQEAKNVLLIETDHQELLNTCRFILEKQTTDTYLDETDYPAIIEQLQPGFVIIDKEKQYIDIAIGGGLYMFGVIACNEGAEAPIGDYTNGGYSCKQLIEGLWYYEE